MARSAGDNQETASTWERPNPPYWRFYQLRSIGGDTKEEAGTPEATPEVDHRFEDKFLYWFERHIRIGRVHGWWWDETWTVYRSENLAEGNAYMRDPKDIGKDELPWQGQFLTTTTRRFFKRLARTFKENDIPQRNFLWANNSATCFESFAWDTQLVEECGGGNRSVDIDNMTMHPSSLYRYLAHNFTGLIARLAPGNIQIESGDDKRLDRQFFARALAYNIGCSYDGPHGRLPHRAQAVRIMNTLWDFGFFKDKDTEVLPYWRSQKLLHFGEQFSSADAFALDAADPLARVHVAIFRRPDGKPDSKQNKVMVVIVNEGETPVRDQLYIDQPKLLFGGPNRLTARDIADAHYDLSRFSPKSDWSASTVKPGGQNSGVSLMDFEDTEFVKQTSAKDGSEVYGPFIHVGARNFRILYATGRSQ